MRRIQKNEIEDLLVTLKEACIELEKYIDNDSTGLCAEIQKFVEDIVRQLEKSEVRNRAIYESLNEVYRFLYYIANGEKEIRHIYEKIQDVQRMVKQLPVDKLEMVFLCYKASMADSLESIYLKARDDPQCDVYFIPIPYFEKTDMGELGQMHLEATDCYSSGIELTDWEKYDIQERKPDAIFIMNPYDHANHITSVHPLFYSSRLREYTKCLVYIEYGLSYWVYKDASSEEIQAKIKENMLLPANIYSHYDIRYSKELAELIKARFLGYEKDLKTTGIDARIECRKILAMGSPKFDKVLAAKKEDYDIPDEWKTKIGNKKIVLYNTGLSELLISSEQQERSHPGYLPRESWYLNKVCAIIEAYYNRDDVVLWWRPHPLFESALISMRPKLLERYKKIVQAYKTKEKGIYDATEELHRAIAWSDGMISDGSSLLLLYAITGKPFYIPSISKHAKDPIYEESEGYHAPLSARIENMKVKGANIINMNTCIWWDNFLEEDLYRKIVYKNYQNRFIDYIVNRETYPEAELYSQLQIQIVNDYVVNGDGTAGAKIYDFIKQKALEAANGNV